MAELLTVGAGGVQADQGNAGARFLPIDPVVPPQNADLPVAADDRLWLLAKTGCRRVGCRRRLARHREHLFEVAQIGHQRVQIALDRGPARLSHGEKVVIAGRRYRRPEFRPGVGVGADGERPGPHDLRAFDDAGDAAALNANMVRRVANLDQKVDVEEPAPPDQMRVGVYKCGQLVDQVVLS